MMAVGDLSKVRRKYADEEARKRREAAAFKWEQRRLIDPLKIIHRDQMLLSRMIGKWRDTELAAAKQVEHLKGIFDQAKKAMAYVANLTTEKKVVRLCGALPLHPDLLQGTEYKTANRG